MSNAIHRLSDFFALAATMSLEGHTIELSDRQLRALSDLPHGEMARAKARTYLAMCSHKAKNGDSEVAIQALVGQLADSLPVPEDCPDPVHWQLQTAYQILIVLCESGFITETKKNFVSLAQGVDYPEVEVIEYLGGILPDDTPESGESALWLGKAKRFATAPVEGPVKDIVSQLNAIALYIKDEAVPEFEADWEKAMWEGHLKACPSVAYLRWRVDGRGRMYPINTLSIQGADWLRSRFRLVNSAKCV